MTSIFAVKSLGINPANGREVFVRPDGTITYDWNAADQVVVGNQESKYEVRSVLTSVGSSSLSFLLSCMSVADSVIILPW